MLLHALHRLVSFRLSLKIGQCQSGILERSIRNFACHMQVPKPHILSIRILVCPSAFMILFLLQGGNKSAPADIASGMPLLVTAADRRARAVYYSFTLLCIGLAVLLVVVLVESHRWRSTITNESAVSRICHFLPWLLAKVDYCSCIAPLAVCPWDT